MATSLNNERLQEICGNLREQLFRNGTHGLSGVARVFKSADFNGNKKLDREEFGEALSFAGLFLSKHDVSFLFKNFDRDNDGNINYNELLMGIRQPLAGARLEVTKAAYNKLDKDDSGVVDLKDFRIAYDASQHPDVREGKKTKDAALLQFLGQFERGTKDGKVTFAEFGAYYEDLGASIPSDSYFVAMMTSCWKLKPQVSKNGRHPIDVNMSLLAKKIQQKTKTGQRESLTLKKIFDFFDKDESGAITIDEFKAALERMGLPLPEKDLKQFFDHFAGSDQRISTMEFIGKMNLDD